MPRITILAHASLCPEGKSFEARPGSLLCETLLGHGIDIEHACDMACACVTCHVLVRQGGASLTPAREDEEDRLDRAWGVEDCSRLACQVVIRHEDLTIELPRYTVNLARETR
ncbi:MAG: ferredoxin [Betaproteobacteria bacterium]